MKSRTKKEDKKKTEQEKVADRRKEVLATGRKFKYPMQWTRHRVVAGAILISFVSLAIVAIGGWFALYRLNLADDFLFRVVKVIPVSVAKVDSENVRFSDYLMFYRSSITSIERQSGSQIDEASAVNLANKYKRAALTEAEDYTYATKLAKELNITVSDADVDAEFARHLQIGGVERSEESFVKIIEDNFSLDKSEYERMLYLTLIKAKVEIAIDTTANSVAEEVESLLASNNNNYQAVAEALGKAVIYEETGGLVDNKNLDGGRATEAAKLTDGASSGRFVSMNGDGYYFVKLISRTDSKVNFVSIKVPFTEFASRMADFRESDQISEYITIPEVD